MDVTQRAIPGLAEPALARMARPDRAPPGSTAATGVRRARRPYPTQTSFASMRSPTRRSHAPPNWREGGRLPAGGT